MFWRVTPQVARAIVAGANDRLASDHNARMSLAWHIAALQRTKKLPKLQTLLAKKSALKARRRQTWQEQLAVMDLWVIASRRAANVSKSKRESKDS